MDGAVVVNRWPSMNPHLTRFLGPTRVSIPNDISIGSAVFAQLMAERSYTLQWAAFPSPSKLPNRQTDRPTDHTTRHVIIGRIYVRKSARGLTVIIILITSSTGTVHTSAKARLIRIRICDPDCTQNLIVCSLAHCQPSLKISCKSV